MLPHMTSMKFVGKVSVMGDKVLIVIPKEFHKQVEPFKGKYVKVTVEEVL
jgi:hypothetical protein